MTTTIMMNPSATTGGAAGAGDGGESGAAGGGAAVGAVVAAEDTDLLTDEKLAAENEVKRRSTSSRGTMRRVKQIMSTIVGDKPTAFRERMLFDAGSTTDFTTWTREEHGVTIHYARVQNPHLILRPPSTSSEYKKSSARRKSSGDDTADTDKTWARLARVERLEIEDSESVMNELPRHVATGLNNLMSLTLTWSRVKTLPPELFLLPSLRALHLQRNHLKHINGIENAARIITLDVSNNHIEALPKTFGENLPSLRTLNLSGNRLRELPPSCGSLGSLKTLDCSCNRLRSLPETIVNLQELTMLDVSSNALAYLPDSIGTLPSLNDLRARSNTLSSLPDSFAQLSTLQSLLLGKNRFESVPTQLSQLHALHSLNLRENELREMNVTIASLRSLVLDHNLLTAIGAGITSCERLELLSLQNNRIREIPQEIASLSNLRTLLLSYNSDVTTLPESLAALGKLRQLGLCGTKIRLIPTSILNMEQLSNVDVLDCCELDTYTRLAHRQGGLTGLRKHYATVGNAANSTNPEEQHPVPVNHIDGDQQVSVDVEGTEQKTGSTSGLSESGGVMLRAKTGPSHHVINNTKTMFPNSGELAAYGVETARDSTAGPVIDKTASVLLGTDNETQDSREKTFSEGRDAEEPTNPVVSATGDVTVPPRQRSAKRESLVLTQKNSGGAAAATVQLGLNGHADLCEKDKTEGDLESSADRKSGQNVKPPPPVKPKPARN